MTPSFHLRDFHEAALIAPYGDDALVGKITAEQVAAGRSILEIHKLADNDRDHVARLLNCFAPAPSAVILDAGCGTGRVSELMAEIRPDLDFVRFNLSPAQLAFASGARVAGDFHALPFPDEMFDGVMFCYSLGHGLLDRVLAEAARVLRPDGVIFIYDLASDDGRALISTLGYQAFPRARVEATADSLGFVCELSLHPEGTSIADFLDVMPVEAYRTIFAGVRPVLYRFRKTARA